MLSLSLSLSLVRSISLSLSLSLSLPLTCSLSRSRARTRSLSLSLSLARSLTLSLSLFLSLLACGVTELNMGQSLYLCFDSAGFCVGTRHGPALSEAAQIPTQGQRDTFFSGRFQISGDCCTQLLRSAAPGGIRWVVIRSREDHSDEKITHHEVGWSPVRNHPVYVRGGQVSDWEESQVLAD